MQTAETLNIDLSRTFIFHHGFRLIFVKYRSLFFNVFILELTVSKLSIMI